MKNCPEQKTKIQMIIQSACPSTSQETAAEISERFLHSITPESIHSICCRGAPYLKERIQAFVAQQNHTQLDFEILLSGLAQAKNLTHPQIPNSFIEYFGLPYLMSCTQSMLTTMMINFIKYHSFIEELIKGTVTVEFGPVRFYSAVKAEYIQIVKCLQNHIVSIVAHWSKSLGDLDVNDFWNDFLVQLKSKNNLFRFQSKFESWAYTVIWNRCRHLKKEMDRFTSIDDLENSKDNQSDPLDLLIDEQHLRLLREGYVLVMPFYENRRLIRCILDYWLGQDKTPAQIVESLAVETGENVSSNQVYQHCFRFKQRMMAYWLGRVERLDSISSETRIGTADARARSIHRKISMLAKITYPRESIIYSLAYFMFLEKNAGIIQIISDLSGLGSLSPELMSGLRTFNSERISKYKDLLKNSIADSYLVFPVWFLRTKELCELPEVISRLCPSQDMEESQIMKTIFKQCERKCTLNNLM